MRNLFKSLISTKTPEPSSIEATPKGTPLVVVKGLKDEIEAIQIENQPFRLSGLLHILTNKLTTLLKEHHHTIYYDIDNSINRYIIGDNDYIEQILAELLTNVLLLNSDFEVILKLSKEKNKFLCFEVINTKGYFDKALYQAYIQAKTVMTSHKETVNHFVKLKKFAEAMEGTLTLASSKRAGTHYTLKIPFYEDEDSRSHQDALQKDLKGKKALFIGKSEEDTKRTQYIFKTYGIDIQNMKLSDFERKKPNLQQYNMAILRSIDLNYKHLSFFKSISQHNESPFKIIIVHELFETEESINSTKAISDAELYSPIVIGDVEEILYQMFILNSKAVKGIDNMKVFDKDAFKIEGVSSYKDDTIDWYKGAHIAIVEDSKMDQRIIRNILKLSGVTLFCLNNGEEMLQLLEKEEIDIIFSDINMPVMDGFIMSQKIRSQKKWEHIPIISISSMGFSHEIEQMKIAGMNGAITKPIVAEHVYMALEKFLVMTAQIRNRELNKNKMLFIFNPNILDVEKGIADKGDLKHYKEHLIETMEHAKQTHRAFEDMVYNQEVTRLKQQARDIISLYQTIHATQMVAMFKELIQFTSQQKKGYLTDYIYIHKKNWQTLEQEVARCLKNIDSCLV